MDEDRIGVRELGDHLRKVPREGAVRVWKCLVRDVDVARVVVEGAHGGAVPNVHSVSDHGEVVRGNPVRHGGERGGVWQTLVLIGDDDV